MVADAGGRNRQDAEPISMTSRSIPAATSSSDLVLGLSALGARFDAAPLFPADSLRLLHAAGYHRRFAPISAGGYPFPDERARFAEMRSALRTVGRGDLSIGRLFEGHVNALLLFGWYGTYGQLSWLNHALDRGAWFGVWATEPTPGTALVSGKLTGAKVFASGAGGLDYALVTAAIEGGDGRLVVVPANEPARADTLNWRVRGMRASVSGRYELEGIEVDAGMLLGDPGDYDRDPRFTAGAWRFCAVQLGGIEALLAEIQQSMSPSAKCDPIQRARFADAVVATRTAGFWVGEAAMRTAAEDADAVAIVRMTRGVVERAGLDVMEAAARILGTRSAFDSERSDKIIRDLSLFLRQAGPDHARDQAAISMLDHDCWRADDRFW
jgi:alkylation response protein AidB-like acyl-CoA dehydrogenase